MITSKIVQGLNVHIIPTKKFKTTTLVLHMQAPLSEETVTMRALLPYVLQSGTKMYPTTVSLRQKLEELYGAILSVDLNKKGENHLMSFRMEVANEQYLLHPVPLIEEAVRLFAEVICHPNVSGNAFDKKVVENEKRSLTQRIQSIYDDKKRYAQYRLMQEMFKEEPYHLNSYGIEEAIESIDEENLYAYYQTCLKTNRFDLYIVGDVEPSMIESLISKEFTIPADANMQGDIIRSNEHIEPKKEQVIFEEQEVNQGKLNIGYRTFTTYKDDDYYALQVFNGVFGGFPHSKLFRNVREKESLAYYASSFFESHKGAMFVASGIETVNYDQALSIIKQQLKDIQDGNISDEEMSQTKAMIVNQLLETLDIPRGMVEMHYQNVIGQFERSIDEWMNEVKNVTKEDVVKMAKKVKLDTVYFLKGVEASK